MKGEVAGGGGGVLSAPDVGSISGTSCVEGS